MRVDVLRLFRVELNHRFRVLEEHLLDPPHVVPRRTLCFHGNADMIPTALTRSDHGKRSVMFARNHETSTRFVSKSMRGMIDAILVECVQVFHLFLNIMLQPS